MESWKSLWIVFNYLNVMGNLLASTLFYFVIQEIWYYEFFHLKPMKLSISKKKNSTRIYQIILLLTCELIGVNSSGVIVFEDRSLLLNLYQLSVDLCLLATCLWSCMYSLLFKMPGFFIKYLAFCCYYHFRYNYDSRWWLRSRKTLVIQKDFSGKPWKGCLLILV